MGGCQALAPTNEAQPAVPVFCTGVSPPRIALLGRERPRAMVDNSRNESIHLLGNGCKSRQPPAKNGLAGTAVWSREGWSKPHPPS